MILRLLLLNVAIKHLDNGRECTFSKFGGSGSKWREWLVHWKTGLLFRGIKTAENCASRSLMKFNKGKSKLLHLGHSNPCSSTGWGLTG